MIKFYFLECRFEYIIIELRFLLRDKIISKSSLDLRERKIKFSFS